MSDKGLFLENARRIGERLVAGAVWQGRRCTWPSTLLDQYEKQQPVTDKKRPLGLVYHGAAGIALFLGQLYTFTQDAALKDTATGAMRYAAASARQMPDHSFSFFEGRVGVAYVLTRLASTLGLPHYLTEAEEILNPLFGKEQKDQGFDILRGAAGAIPALLTMSGCLAREPLLASARKLGNHLIEVADKEVAGWSWDTRMPWSVRNLTGLSHGAAGIGYALLELFYATGESTYLYAAEQAFLYERRFFDPQRCNWPDFRHNKLGILLYGRSFDQIQALVEAGPLPAYAPTYCVFWCHGAPGIGLTRLRAFELLRHPVYREEATAALEAIQGMLHKVASKQAEANYSLCHGIGGICETLLYAAEVLEQPSLRKQAEEWGRRGWEQFEQAGQPWPCGIEGFNQDPSLMLGEAGIGYFYLRLYSPDTPSLLLPRVPEELSRRSPDRQGYVAVRTRYINRYFGRTVRIVDRLGARRSPELSRALSQNPVERSDVAITYEALRRWIDRQEDEWKDLLEDAFALERLKYEASLKLAECANNLSDELHRPGFEEVFLRGLPVRWSPCTATLLSRWDWDGWLDLAPAQRPPVPAPDEIHFLIYRAENVLVWRRINPLSACLLEHMRRPISCVRGIDEVVRSFTPGDSAHVNSEGLRSKLKVQLEQLYNARVVQCKRGRTGLQSNDSRAADSHSHTATEGRTEPRGRAGSTPAVAAKGVHGYRF